MAFTPVGIRSCRGVPRGRPGRGRGIGGRGLGAGRLPGRASPVNFGAAAAGAAARRRRRHHAHRDDVLQRLVDAHLAARRTSAARHHQEEARGRVRRGRHVDADVVARQVRRHLAAGLAGDEGDGPGAVARVLHQHRLAEGVAAAREQRVRDLLDRAVDRLDDRDAAAAARSHWRSHHWPKMLVTKTPVSSSTSTSTTHAQAGHVAQLLDAARAPTPAAPPGVADSSHAKTPSSAPSSHDSTQIVMASGSQTSRPATRYFFTRAACVRAAVAGAAAAGVAAAAGAAAAGAAAARPPARRRRPAAGGGVGRLRVGGAVAAGLLGGARCRPGSR